MCFSHLDTFMRHDLSLCLHWYENCLWFICIVFGGYENVILLVYLVPIIFLHYNNECVSFRISIGIYTSCHSCVYPDTTPMPTSSDLYYAITPHIYLHIYSVLVILISYALYCYIIHNNNIIYQYQIHHVTSKCLLIHVYMLKKKEYI